MILFQTPNSFLHFMTNIPCTKKMRVLVFDRIIVFIYNYAEICVIQNTKINNMSNCPRMFRVPEIERHPQCFCGSASIGAISVCTNKLSSLDSRDDVCVYARAGHPYILATNSTNPPIHQHTRIHT